MANFNYHQALNATEQKKIFHRDLQCYVNYMHQFILDDATKYEPLTFVFKYGMPGKFPEGQWGFTFYGDLGVLQRPIVLKGDPRIAPRWGQMQRYEVKLGSLFRIISPFTDYYEYESQKLANPHEITNMHLAALSRTIPLYQKYILYKIFAGTNYKAKNTYVKSWFEKYIEPSDGNTNGYAFCLSEGRGEVSLTPVIKPNKVKTNELKNRLDAIGAALRSEARKMEWDSSTDPLLQTDYIKRNLTNDNKKTLSLIMKAADVTGDIVRDGKFPDKKYMHKDFKSLWYKWETDTSKHKEQVVKFTDGQGQEIEWDTWETPVKSESELVVLFNRKAWEKLQMNEQMSNPVTKFIEKGVIEGRFIPHDMIDEGEALIMHRDLIQLWILPSSVQYAIEPYTHILEQTTDHIHAFDHSLDILPFHSSIWLKLKIN